jgi:DNA-binding transcriptional MocR family regulator
VRLQVQGDCYREQLGWIRAPRALAAKVTRIKALLDVASPAFMQSVAFQLFNDLKTIAEARRQGLRERYELTTATGVARGAERLAAVAR